MLLFASKVERGDKKVDMSRQYYRKDSGIEARQVIEEWQLSFNLGCVLKYVCRAGLKPNVPISSDIEKALDYIDYEIDFYDRVLKREIFIVPYNKMVRIPAYTPPEVLVDAWGLSSDQANALRLIHLASKEFLSYNLKSAIVALEDLIITVVKLRS